MNQDSNDHLVKKYICVKLHSMIQRVFFFLPLPCVDCNVSWVDALLFCLLCSLWILGPIFSEVAGKLLDDITIDSQEVGVFRYCYIATLLWGF